MSKIIIDTNNLKNIFINFLKKYKDLEVGDVMLLREGEMCDVIQIQSVFSNYFVMTKKYLEEHLMREQQITYKGIASDSRVEFEKKGK